MKQNKGNDWIKYALSLGTSATVETVAGIGALAVASSLFVPASLLTTIQVDSGLKTWNSIEEATKKSKFLSDVGSGLNISFK